jgi:hypothetical protein
LVHDPRLSRPLPFFRNLTHTCPLCDPSHGQSTPERCVPTPPIDCRTSCHFSVASPDVETREHKYNHQVRDTSFRDTSFRGTSVRDISFWDTSFRDTLSMVLSTHGTCDPRKDVWERNIRGHRHVIIVLIAASSAGELGIDPRATIQQPDLLKPSYT